MISYREAVERALAQIGQNHVPSSWIDSLAAGTLPPRLFAAVKVPEHGVFTDSRTVPLTAGREQMIERVWSIGGTNGGIEIG